MISVNSEIPDLKIWEYNLIPTDACPIGPVELSSKKELDGKKIGLFGLPGAFTPTCSAKHLPGFIELHEKLNNILDEIWCVSVNDAFVMNAWGNDQKVQGKIRMIGIDQTFATNLGLELNLEARGMGVRIQRFSMLIDNNVVKSINVEGPGKFEVSTAEVLLNQATEIF